MDQLLTLIEDSPSWKAMFGFDKSTSGSAIAISKDKSTLKHSADIAVALFIDYVAGVQWTFDDINMLQGVIKIEVTHMLLIPANVCLRFQATTS